MLDPKAKMRYGAAMVKSALSPVTTPSAASEAAERLRDAIFAGDFEPGARLKEEELAGRLGLSRTPIKRALWELEQGGLVEITPNRGARVKIYGSQDLEEIFELRALLECPAARLAAERIDEQSLMELDASCDRFDKLLTGDDTLALVQENVFFHDLIVQTVGNKRLSDAVRSAGSLPFIYQTHVWFSSQSRHKSGQDHRDLVAALRNRDGEQAAVRMQDHITQARDLLRAKVGPDGRWPNAASERR